MIYVMGDIHGNMRRFNSVIRCTNSRPKESIYYKFWLIIGIPRIPGNLIIKFPAANGGAGLKNENHLGTQTC